MRKTTCWTAIGAVTLCCMAVAGGVEAQTYPVKPVRIIVPTSPGGGNDFVARHIGQKLSERLGQQFLVENRPGAGGTIGTALAAKSAPDGYTLLLGFVGQLAMSPHVEKAGYDPLKDFIGVSLLASSYHVLAIHPSLPVRSVKELIAFAKKRPGELNYASGNIWTPTHLVPELFKSATGTDIVAIQYKGSGPAAVGVLTGEAQVIFASVTAVMPYVRGNRLVALAVTSPGALRSPPRCRPWWSWACAAWRRRRGTRSSRRPRRRKKRSRGCTPKSSPVGRVPTIANRSRGRRSSRRPPRRSSSRRSSRPSTTSGER